MINLNQELSNRWMASGGKTKAWVVSLRGEHADIVWFDSALTARQVKARLIYQDGYSVDISICQPS